MKISSITRINFSIVMLCASAIMFAAVIGVLPDERVYQATNRAKLCESLATNVSYLIAKHELRQASDQLELFASRNEDVVSIGLRRFGGDLAVEWGHHDQSWRDAVNRRSDGCYVVSIQNRTSKWGTLELQFQPLYQGRNQFFSDSLIMLLLMVTGLVGLACWLHLRRILCYLDPSRSVPVRVRQALDNFAEGVVVLDTQSRIVLSNDTFAKHVQRQHGELLGLHIWDLPWELPDASIADKSQRFTQAMRGAQLKLTDAFGEVCAVFSVNASPVLDDNQRSQGLMMAFTDVTPLERNRAALESTLSELQSSKQEISKQNEELRYLATRDPLTSCINRRTFFELFEKHWANAKNNGVPLCGMMVDIDFFKSINDNYGHSMGDEVLRQTGKLLNQLARPDDVVCRYGGEEFAILLPGSDLQESAELAEAIRTGMSQLVFEDFTITASLGVSGHSLGAADPQEMLDQADKCLYVAKRNGRDQVVRFDTVPEDLIVDESKISRVKPDDKEAAAASIPYAAVTALLSALSYRDHQTGTHSSRVSAYAALLAQRVVSAKEVYVIEIAALLHDIGKVGVPDAILLKPGKLTREEWQVMEKHDRIGVEIISNSFKHPELTDIIRCHHYRYGGVQSESQPVWGQDIPIGARILTIVDAFDAIVSDRPYRKARTTAEAVEELRRCAGTQFDPELVEHFVAIVESRSDIQSQVATARYNNEVVLRIGEQVERLIEAADCGDGPTFVALADRLMKTAQQHNVQPVAEAAAHAIEAVNEDTQLACLVAESFELLNACRAMQESITTYSNQPEHLETEAEECGSRG